MRSPSRILAPWSCRWRRSIGLVAWSPRSVGALEPCGNLFVLPGNEAMWATPGCRPATPRPSLMPRASRPSAAASFCRPRQLLRKKSRPRSMCRHAAPHERSFGGTERPSFGALRSELLRVQGRPLRTQARGLSEAPKCDVRQFLSRRVDRTPVFRPFFHAFSMLSRRFSLFFCSCGRIREGRFTVKDFIFHHEVRAPEEYKGLGPLAAQAGST